MAIDGFDELGEGSACRPWPMANSTAAGSTASCAAWASDAALRADWHAWHLIGDVLRSEDLASDPAPRSTLFAPRSRSRLQAEPVVLAPAPALADAAGRRFDARRRARGRWTAAGAVAAGFVLVVGTFASFAPASRRRRADRPGADAPRVDHRSPVAAAPDPARRRPRQPVAIVADGKIIRDAQLERYLEAHKQFAGTSALGVPSAFLRSATVDSAAR